ncbi:hypothetical protein Tco_1505160 [Tanacetum coccineum]
MVWNLVTIKRRYSWRKNPNMDKEITQGKSLTLHNIWNEVNIMFLTTNNQTLHVAVCMCCPVTCKPTEKHLHAYKKKLLKYLREPVNRDSVSNDSSIALTVYADADHADVVQLSSKRQKSAAISSTEAEYIAFSRVQVENGVVEILLCHYGVAAADIFTKALAEEEFEFLINNLGMQRFYVRETPETIGQMIEE